MFLIVVVVVVVVVHWYCCYLIVVVVVAVADDVLVLVLPVVADVDDMMDLLELERASLIEEHCCFDYWILVEIQLLLGCYCC